MANLVTLARVVLLFATVALMYYDDYRAALAAALLTLVVILGDAVDGWVARHWDRPTEFGSVFDIAGDRVVENVYFVVFAHLGLIPIWMPLVVIARSFLIDALRGLSFQRGRTAFGPKSMMVSTVGKWLSSSRASRALYGAAKAVTFAVLTIALAFWRLGLQNDGSIGALTLIAGSVLAYVTVAFCVLRGAVVLYDARGLFWHGAEAVLPTDAVQFQDPAGGTDRRA